MDVPGKALFYNDLTGILMVRASHEDLEVIQAAIETLGGEPERKAANSIDKTNWASRPKVVVFGQVNKGGGIPIPSGQRLTLRDALAAAGGLTRMANKNHINVIHGGNQVSKFRYDAILTATDAADNPVLADGDVVNVP